MSNYKAVYWKPQELRLWKTYLFCGPVLAGDHELCVSWLAVTVGGCAHWKVVTKPETAVIAPVPSRVKVTAKDAAALPLVS